jgi:hypothetical protein
VSDGSVEVVARAITSQVKGADSLPALRALCLRHARELNTIHATAALSRAVKLTGKRSLQSNRSDHSALQDIVNVVAAAVTTPSKAPALYRWPIRPQDASTIIHSLGKLSMPNRPLLSFLLQTTEQFLGDFTPYDLVQLLWGLATLQVHPGKPWMDAVATASRSRHQEYNSHDCALTAWSFARLGYSPG